MANEIVKYHHELNTIPLRKFTPVEMNLFFSIVSRMRDVGDKKVQFTFEQLKDLSNYKATANVRFIDDLETTYDKLMDLRFGRRSADGLQRERFVLFNQFKIDGKADIPFAEIQVHEKALPLLNNLEEWVRYSLQQFNELESSYAKTMFRLLKQFRTKGVAYFSKEDFHELLDIPKSYRQSDINKNVIKPIQQELTAIFKGLTIKKKYGKGRGKPVIGYQFTFKPEIKKADDFNKHAPTKEEQNKALALADKQKEYEEPITPISEKIKQKKRELELLEQIKQLEKEKEALEQQNKETVSQEEKKKLLEDLNHLFDRAE
ncbi:replication initiation protein [Enterococcus gallinarum]|uniref:RepB family plasmid replication initiator protein n=6 Tax=Enterococcus TaxID=1350 RepID=A0A6A8NMP2_ENTFC|nr:MULTISPECIES: replication initiation protein [Enterococcus]EHG5971894.1 RepB family plasmid replication initiator protein [Enterococcus faecalis]MCB8532038.1 replication initiation protein [Enterococcus faecalis]MCB8545273.1 replication initiation protein [Enterococcus faecalis]MCO5519519.1 replication initiation protein [Enterococcus faecalis]MDT2319389.1 replication initiation protein [Enterococcus faecium]